MVASTDRRYYSLLDELLTRDAVAPLQDERRTMKILLAPCTDAPRAQLILPHLIPLVALASQLDPREYQATFLAPRWFHQSLRALGYHVQDIDYDLRNPFRSEMMAYGRFRPDVVVDDMSATALLSTSLAGIPRVTIRRTGVFPGASPRNGAHRHSVMHVSLIDRYKGCEEVCGVPQPKSLADVYAAAASVVPGIPAVETLPSALTSDPSYRFSGPLILPDEAACTLVGGNHQEIADALSEFLKANQGRLIVFVTVGTILKGWNLLIEVMRYILHSGAAVISTVEAPDVEASFRDRYLFAPFLPLDAVCSSVHFMVHHCGSGTYQYQLLHMLPAICIGSGCYDRDDVAARLDELGVAKYIPSPEETPDFLCHFQAHFDECADVAGAWYTEAKQKLAGLKADSDRTAAEFDFATALHTARSSAST